MNTQNIGPQAGGGRGPRVGGGGCQPRPHTRLRANISGIC